MNTIFLLLGFIVSFSSLGLCSTVYSRNVPSEKLMVGYFAGMQYYDNNPLPKGVSDAWEMLEAQMGSTIALYNVIVQTFIHPTDIVNNKITESSKVASGRQGVNGKKGLRQLCTENGVQLVIAFGGGGAPQMIPNDLSQHAALINAMYDYVTANGYDGIDIDEENAIDTATYVAFMKALAKKFHSGPKYLTVSIAVGPLYCCYASRGLCALNDDLDWVFLMLYDGLNHNAAFDVDVTSVSSPYISQTMGFQSYCNISKDPSLGLPTNYVGDVAIGSCQFINYALHLNWSPDKIIMGLPSYSYPSSMSWGDIQSRLTMSQTDTKGLISLYSKSSTAEWIPSASDISQRIQFAVNPAQSRLGVQYESDGSSKVKISKCTAAGKHAGAALRGAGFWHIGYETADHHELSLATRTAIDSINIQLYGHTRNYTQPVTTKLITTKALSTGAVTTKAITSAALTTKAAGSTTSRVSATTGAVLPLGATTQSANPDDNPINNQQLTSSGPQISTGNLKQTTTGTEVIETQTGQQANEVLEEHNDASKLLSINFQLLLFAFVLIAIYV